MWVLGGEGPQLERIAPLLVQAQTRVLRKVKNAFLSRVFAVGEVGQTGSPLSAAVETEEDVPIPCQLREQKAQ